MTANPFWSVRPALALAAAAFLVAGCGSDGGTGDDGDEPEGPSPIERAQLEDEVSTKLEELVGQAPDSVECPEDLVSEVDATTRCTLTAGPDTLGVTVTVTSVEGGQTNFDIEVDEEIQ